MATNLKKGKQMSAFICRMLTFCAFLCMIASAVAGRNALHAFSQAGFATVTGDFYYLPQFQSYMENLYNNAILGYTDSISAAAKESFQNAIAGEKGDIAYAVKLLYPMNENDSLVTPAEQSNISYPVFSTYDGHLLLPEGMTLCYYWDGPTGTLTAPYATSLGSSAGQYKPNQAKAAQVKLMLAVRSDKKFEGKVIAGFAETAKNYQNILITFFTSCFCTVLFFLLSLLTKKNFAAAMQGYGNLAKKICLEIKLALLAIMGFAFYKNMHTLLSPLSATTGLLLVGLFFSTGCLFYLLWADICRNGKAVLINSFPVKLVSYGKEFVNSCYWYRILMIACMSIMISALFSLIVGGIITYISIFPRKVPGTPLIMFKLPYLPALGRILLVCGVLLILFYFILRHFAKDAKQIAERLSQIRLDNLNEPMTLSKDSLLKSVASDINRLEDSIETIVEQRNRSNKMRVELITNISHDLKTPLTSIINYADLLCEEELSPQAAEYASSLKTKAYRLKKMVQDVFDLSKATSGNLPVEMHPLDLAKLVSQTLADMEDRITASGLQFKTTFTEKPLMIMADGDKLYRVFQNLIVNALQYSLEGSRVHVQLSIENEKACVKIKNTSKWELDFDTEEIMERFVRADASRTTEGSGLGLSIAQSFTEACGGNFTITTDADMFTACLHFPLLAETE